MDIKMRKALLIILVAVMCIGILPVSVFADCVIPQTCPEASFVNEDLEESPSEEDPYNDFIYRITHFKLENFSDFLFWLFILIVAIVAIVVIIIVAIILFIVFGIILEVVIVPILTAILGPFVGPIGGTIASVITALVGAVITILTFILPYLPEIFEMLYFYFILYQ